MISSVAESNAYEHTGTVSRISGCSVFVALEANIHCESCRAKAACGVADSKSREIEVQNPSETFTIDEPVKVIIRKSLGLKAVFWAYVFPFMLVIGVLFVASRFMTEWMAGLTALAALGPYYLFLHLARTFFETNFKVSVLKMS